MKLATLNYDLDREREQAERHYAEMEKLYTSIIVQAGREAAKNLLLSAQVTTMVAAVTPDWQPPPADTLLDSATLAERALKKFSRLHRRIVRDVTGTVLARAGIAWDITHPLSQALLDSAGQRTGVRLGLGVQDTLRETVADAYVRGLSVVDAAALISEKIAEVAPGQAQMLARTDLNSLANGGSVMAAQMVGVGYKTWLTAEDDRVREDHIEADGQTVPIDQPFDVCGESLDYPGDPAGSDACVCNCRCSVIYSDSLDVGEVASARVPSRGMATLSQPTAGTRTLGGRVPARGFAAAIAEVVSAPAWVSDLAFEGTATSDGRYILPDALTWRDLPLSLGAMFDTPHADIVTASPVVGRIDTIEKRDDDMEGATMGKGVRAVRGYGVFDLAGADGANVARLVADETLRGVSIDLAVDEWTYRDPETGELIDPDEASDADMERAMFGELQYAVVAGSIMAATVCPTPAFADARIALTASSDGRRVMRVWAPIRLAGAALTASAAGLAPTKPKSDWFATPEAAKPTPLTVTPDGRVFGHMALWDSCHTGYPGQCVPPPRSSSGYTYFHLGEVECADGSRVAAGAITLETLHADTDRPLSNSAVRHHYEHTGVVGAYVRATDGVYGIWVSGALRANLSERHARDLMGAKPSGDWRQTRPGGPLEMLGVHAVNEPGYPVPRLVASALLPSGGRAVLEFAEPASTADRVPARGFARAV